jgi:hypothetical protein
LFGTVTNLNLNTILNVSTPLGNSNKILVILPLYGELFLNETLGSPLQIPLFVPFSFLPVLLPSLTLVLVFYSISVLHWHGGVVDFMSRIRPRLVLVELLALRLDI